MIGVGRNITVAADPEGSGTVSGGGTYVATKTATVTANPNEHYNFVNWTENGEEVSTNPEYKFTVTGDRELVANFEKEKHTITFVNYDGTELQSGPVECGELPVYEGDEPTRPSDAQYTYTFAGWEPEITSVTGDATYIAKYTAKAIDDGSKSDDSQDSSGGESNSGDSSGMLLTGDKRNIWLWVVLIAVSSVGLIIAFVWDKKRSRRIKNK